MADNSISYLNKTFPEFKANLINYAKTYFPTVYNDFTEATPGNLFIELASYVGDVSSFYIDTQVQENFLLYAKEKENLYALSYMLGYRPKVSYAANTLVDIDNDAKSYGFNKKVIYASIKSQFYTNSATASLLTEVGRRKSYASNY